jgi:hypothetical protein
VIVASSVPVGDLHDPKRNSDSNKTTNKNLCVAGW